MELHPQPARNLSVLKIGRPLEGYPPGTRHVGTRNSGAGELVLSIIDCPPCGMSERFDWVAEGEESTTRAGCGRLRLHAVDATAG